MFVCLKLFSSSYSVEIKSVLLFVYLTLYPMRFAPLAAQPLGLTLFNNKNGCPSSTGTGTLRRQRPMFHLLNPLKTVPPLGHFQPNILINKLKCR